VKALILGATGMAGHTICLYLSEKGHDITTISRKPFPYCKNIQADITNFELLKSTINNGFYDVVINCIGILNSDAENNKSYAVLLNSFLPHFLSEITEEMNTKVIQMSTDCVFSGLTGNYFETSLKDGETFYDRSKALGEIENSKDLTFRNSIIGPDISANGIGLFNWFMKQKGELQGYTKAIWSGVTTLTLAKAMESAVYENISGIYHLGNNKVISKYELLTLFNNYFKNGDLKITVSEDVVVDKSLINTRNDFNFKVPSYEQMINEMKEWVLNHRDFYSHYFR
jgi:dTDP-4-dehydrorhamnose reductase